MIQIHNADCLDADDGLGRWPDLSFDVAITDPPYSEHTHNKQRRGATDYPEHANGKRRAEFSRVRNLGFDPLTDRVREGVAYHLARLVRRWVLVFTDDRGLQPWADALQAEGLEWVRTLIWIKVGGAPQFSGDRPAVGNEHIVLAHRSGRKQWNGGGRHGVYWFPIVLNRGGKRPRLHTAQKPILLMSELVKDFTMPGESVLDPFAGSGTTLLSCKRHGRDCVGYERDPEIAEIARERLGCKLVQPERLPDEQPRA